MSTGWEDGEVRAFRLPSAPRAEDAPRAAGPGAGLPAITDPALRAAVGAALGKAPGETASQADLAGLESLKARNAGIRDLAGLEDAVSLKELDLGFNPLADLRPLAALPALKSLNLDGAGLDLRALASLAGLRRLSLRHNGIAELGALAPLAGLAELGRGRQPHRGPLPAGEPGRAESAAGGPQPHRRPVAAGVAGGPRGAGPAGEPCARPAALAGLARLTTLRLGGNGLAELHPLSVLEGLQELGLAGNAVRGPAGAVGSWRVAAAGPARQPGGGPASTASTAITGLGACRRERDRGPRAARRPQGADGGRAGRPPAAGRLQRPR